MEDKLDLILEQLKNLDKRLTLVENTLQNINNASVKMDDHINFIQKTYNTIRKPLNFMTNRIEVLMGTSSNGNLPEIKK